MMLRRSIQGCLLAAGASLAPVIAVAQPAPIIPITVERVHIAETGPESPRQVIVGVRNTGSATIEAWGVAGEVRFSNGETRRVGVGTDTYETASLPESLRSPAEKSGRLPPGASATISATMPTPPPGATVVGASGIPTYAVFEDDTAIGDERYIENVFRSRQLSRQVWRIADETLTAAFARGLDTERTFDAMMQALEGAGADASKSIAASIVRRILGRSPTVQTYERLRMEITARRPAAERHAERKR
jgi:hypothetical protein